MNIYVVSKSEPTLLIKPLSQPSLLLESQRRTEQSQHLLRQIKLHNQEVRCCCLPSPARMFVRFTHDYFTLVNHPSEGQHHHSCPLHTNIHGYSSRDADNANRDAIPNDDNPFSRFSVHRAASKTPSRTSPLHQSTNRSSIRECSVDKLVRRLIMRSFHNYHYQNKSLTVMQALNKLVASASEIPFGNTTLNHYLFYGQKGLEFAREKLGRVVKNNSYDGAGRPHALVFFSVSHVEQLSPCSIQMDGCDYHVKKVYNRVGNSKTNDACLVVLTLALNPSTSNSIELYNAYIYPVLHETLFMPISSDLERNIASGLVRLINNSDAPFSWSFSKPLFSLQDREQSHAVLPTFILKSKNKNKKVNFVEVIEVVNNHEQSRPLLPLSLELWQANLASQVDPANPESIANFWLHHQL